MLKIQKWKALILFQQHGEFNEWPLGVILKIIFLNRAYIREICCYCNQTLKFKRSEKIIGDSGEICPTCLRKEYPELYEELKAAGYFSSEQICSAEKIKP